MSHIDFSSYSPKLLTETLRILRDYKNSLRQVGKRSILSDRRIVAAHTPQIEYAKGVDTDLLKKCSE